MKSVLISIKPYFVFLIIAKALGWNIERHKTIEVRKSVPVGEWDRIVHIYCTNDRRSFKKIPAEYQPLMERFIGKVVGEFKCDEVDEYQAELTDLHIFNCMDKDVCLNTIAKVRQNEDDGEAVLDYLTGNEEESPDDCNFLKQSCLTLNEVRQYVGKTFYDKSFYGWHISELKIYDNPKELSKFHKICNNRCSCYELCGGVPKKDDFGLNKPQNEKCFFGLSRPPQSWCYVEALHGT